MVKKWTEQQQNAVNATGGTVLVSAAAGSGKTAVLVERVIRLITREENPLDIDRLLIVTFTRAAAKEMRDRISRALEALLENDPRNMRLIRQRRLLYSANICTIDSFCGDLVREYFHSLGISHDYRIGDEGELEILSEKALDAALLKFYENGGAPFKALLDVFADKNGDVRLRKAILKLKEFLEARPFPEKWLEGALEEFKADSASETVWAKIVIESAHGAVSHGINITENSIKLAYEDEKLRNALTPLLESDRAYFERVQNALFGGDRNKIRSVVMSFESGRLASPRGYKDNPLLKSVKSNRDEVKKTVAELKKSFLRDEAELTCEINELYPIMSVLFELEKEYSNRLRQLKNEKNILSFADVELLAVRLLAVPSDSLGFECTPWAREIAARFDAVMVDEFQDINDVQDIIFRAVSGGEKNLFAVGDVKQSIYGFRQAKPEIFIERKNKYARFDAENPSYPAAIILDKNFRSRAQVCDAVNFIFARLMSEETAKMDYGEDERLVNGADFEPSDCCGFELTLVETGDGESGKAELEAKYIAEKILKMRTDGFTVKDGDGVRPVQFGDFAVILRSTKDVAAKYVDILGRYLIPAYSENKSGLFDAPEIKVMLNLLRTIDNPCRDIPLLSVLCSPVYSFSPDELAEMRGENKRESLYASVCAYAERNGRAGRFLNDLGTLRAEACTSGIDELISKVFEVTDFDSLAVAAGGNEIALKNLELLREYARGCESCGMKMLSDFVTYMDRLIANESRLDASSQNGGQVENAVRVLSIHASKGLEFPVVFLADAGHKFNKTDLSKDLLIDGDAGVGIKLRRGQVVRSTFVRDAAALHIKRSLAAEELRVLYVALTRAKEKLIAVGSVKNADDYFAAQFSKLVLESEIEPFTVTNASCYLDWLTLCALVHPSQNALRQTVSVGVKSITQSGELPWQINVMRTADGESSPVDAARDDMLLEVLPHGGALSDGGCAEILKRNLDFKYKNAEILKLPQKVSASKIAHGQNGNYFDKIISKPSFAADFDSSAVERGTAHHLFLQYCSFSAARADIDGELDRMLTEGRLTEEQAKLIDKNLLMRFVSSPLADRIIASALVMREKRFTARLAPSVVFDEYKDVQTDSTVIIQGAVDLAFAENGGLVIVDYKTDRVNDISKLKELYSKQLMLYKAAMEQTTETQVNECIIFSLNLGEYVEIGG